MPLTTSASPLVYNNLPRHSKVTVHKPGVPDGAARQKTRSTGCIYAGWEILALDHLLPGIFVQRLAS